VLAEDAGAAAKIEGLAGLFTTTGETADVARLKLYAAAVGVPAVESKMSVGEEKAAHMVPVRLKPAPTGFGGGLGAGAARLDPTEASRQQYNTMEMRGFADGKRSVLDIRNALTAEYGPQPIEKVTVFFEGLAKTGEFQIKTQ
jgi:hypothetical protein